MILPIGWMISSNKKSATPRIFFIRGRKIMLDADIAALYQVSIKALRRTVQRNKQRFPHDFMFVRTPQEVQALGLKIMVSNKRGRKPESYAFTAEGLLMLSGLLKSACAAQVSVAIVDASDGFSLLSRLLTE